MLARPCGDELSWLLPASPGSVWGSPSQPHASVWAQLCAARLARLGHAQHTPCAHRLPCAPPFSIPCQSLNLNEASRMAALRQCLDENRAGIASGRAQGLSLPISHGALEESWEPS